MEHQMGPFTPLVSTIIGSVGFAFFLALAVAAYRGGPPTRQYVPGSVLVMIGCLGTLIRLMFFLTGSPHPATLTGQLRLILGLPVFIGGIMLFCKWRKDPRRGQPGSHV
jgi:hypothetical protein